MKISSKKLLNLLSIILFLIYLALLTWVVVFKCNYKQAIIDTYQYFGELNLVERFNFSLNELVNYFNPSKLPNFLPAYDQDIQNVIIFIPLGIYLGYFLKRLKFLQVFVISLLVSAVCEIFQFFSLIGACSFIDLITNTLGGLVGLLVYKIIYKESEKRIKVLNVLSLIVIVIAIPVLCYAVISTANNFDFYLEVLQRRL